MSLSVLTGAVLFPFVPAPAVGSSSGSAIILNTLVIAGGKSQYSGTRLNRHRWILKTIADQSTVISGDSRAFDVVLISQDSYGPVHWSIIEMP
jgi:hypothetical protein